MKKTLWIPAVLLFCGLTALGCEEDHSTNNSCDHYAEEPFEYTVEVTDQVRFRLAGITGSVEIIGQPGVDTITIAGEKRVGASSTDEARSHLDDIEIDIQDGDDEVFVRTVHHGDAEGRCYSVDYTITPVSYTHLTLPTN